MTAVGQLVLTFPFTNDDEPTLGITTRPHNEAELVDKENEKRASSGLGPMSKTEELMIFKKEALPPMGASRTMSPSGDWSTAFDLSGRRELGDKAAASVAAAMASNPKLSTLRLRHNHIGDSGAAALADALLEPGCGVTDLDLSSNDIGDAGAKALAEAIRQPECRLTTLDLSAQSSGYQWSSTLSR